MTNVTVIAKYLRTSDKDIDMIESGKHESNSISNQRDLLDEYIRKMPEYEYCKVVEYLDDGFTGTNFSRPGVQKLIELAELGEIHCIVVKDISRWGRSYLEVGDFLEQKFPAWGVRFISIGDGYDSLQLNGSTGGIEMAFRGLIAQMYSQDLSDKVQSSLATSNRSGKLTISHPPYGYDKADDNRHSLVVNHCEAKIVKKIFTLAEQGMSASEIVRLLNAENITSPHMSKQQRGVANWTVRGNSWGRSVVRRILGDEKYLGKWIYGKTRMTEFGSGKQKRVPKSEWIVVEGAIPQIISDEQFANVQLELSKVFRKGEQSNSPGSLFKRKVRCAFCGCLMVYHKRKTGKHIFFCRTNYDTDKYNCLPDRIEERLIYDAVLAAIQIQLALEKKEAPADNAKISASKKVLPKNEIEMLRQATDKTKSAKIAMWEKYHKGEITREAFQKESNKFSERIAKHEAAINELEVKAGQIQMCSEEETKFIEHYSKLQGINELTSDIVRELVSSIHVHAPDRIEVTLAYSNPLVELAVGKAQEPV